MKLIKLLLSVVLAALIALTAQRLYVFKTDQTAQAYSDIIFTRLAVEAQTYTRQIEYGIKNGKSLDNFYDVESILSEVKRCYSYTTGAYIVSDTYRLLYKNADVDEPTPERIRNMQGVEDAYSVLNDSTHRRYLISIPIHGRDDVTAGYMILSVNYDALENTLDDNSRENLIQTMIIAVLAFLAGSVALIHRRVRMRHFFIGTGVTIAGTMVAATALDGVLSTYKLLVRIENIIGHSVSKIIMSLQYDLNAVGEKGVAFNKIYDLNTFLQEVCDQVPFVDTLIYDKNYQISAVASESYVWMQTGDYAVSMIFAVLGCAAAGILVILAGAIADVIREYFRLTKISDYEQIGRNNNDNRRKSDHPSEA